MQTAGPTAEAMSDISDTLGGPGGAAGTAPPPATRGPVAFQRLRVLFALVVRETGTRFGKSYGGYFWAVAEPLGGIAMLTFAFGLALRKPPIGTSFALFYASGILPFMLYNNVARSVASAVNTNRGLLRYPVVTALDTVFSKFVLEFVTTLVVGTLLVVGIVLADGLDLRIDPVSIVLSAGLAGMLGLGIGTLNCVLYGFFPTWHNVWGVLTRPLVLASGLFYTFGALPVQAQAVLWYNPMIHVVGLMRAGFYGAYDVSYASPLYVLGFGLVPFVVGAYLLRRHESALVEL